MTLLNLYGPECIKKQSNSSLARVRVTWKLGLHIIFFLVSIIFPLTIGRNSSQLFLGSAYAEFRKNPCTMGIVNENAYKDDSYFCRNIHCSGNSRSNFAHNMGTCTKTKARVQNGNQCEITWMRENCSILRFAVYS